jgi:hypothetical protein
MLSSRVEHDYPTEWLHWLAHEAGAYQLLVADAGGLAGAAYRLARAGCRAEDALRETPTLLELQAAALTIARELGVLESLPITSLLRRAS